VIAVSRRFRHCEAYELPGGEGGPDGEEAEHGGLLHLTATEAVRHISEGSLSAETYARALLAQAERLNFLDMIISIDPDAVLEAAHLVDVSQRRGRRLGPVAGLPLLPGRRACSRTVRERTRRC